METLTHHHLGPWVIAAPVVGAHHEEEFRSRGFGTDGEIGSV
jgi:hypothetical protein